MFNKFFPLKSCRLRDNVEKYGRAGQATDEDITRSMWLACWVTKATDFEYVILIGFPRQRWLGERALTSRYSYIASLLYVKLKCHFAIMTHFHALFI
jgi:hypothetical protein